MSNKNIRIPLFVDLKTYNKIQSWAEERQVSGTDSQIMNKMLFDYLENTLN